MLSGQENTTQKMALLRFSPMYKSKIQKNLEKIKWVLTKNNFAGTDKKMSIF